MKINFRKIFDRLILFVYVGMPLTLGIVGMTAILKSDKTKKAPQLVIEIPADYEMNWINFYGGTAKPSPLHWFHRCTYESSFFPKGTETDTLHIILLLRRTRHDSIVEKIDMPVKTDSIEDPYYDTVIHGQPIRVPKYVVYDSLQRPPIGYNKKGYDLWADSMPHPHPRKRAIYSMPDSSIHYRSPFE